MEQASSEKKNLNRPPRKGLNDFGRYSGIAFQMIAVILLTTWGGKKLDLLFHFENPTLVIVLSLLGVFAAIYIAVKDFIK